MKKKVLTAAVAAMITLTTGVVMANPVDIDGSVSYRYRADSSNGANEKNGSITRFTLNAKSQVAKNLSVYARFAAEGLSDPNVGPDFSGGKSFIGEIDQFGLLYNNAGFTYKLGQQAPVIGGLGLFYDASGYLGKQDMGVADGINIKGKSGVTSLDFLAVQENNKGAVDNKIYSVRASYNPTKALTLGATLAQYKAAENTNYYGADASYADGKATYMGEYAKSDANDNNKGYAVGLSYAPDSKNTVWVYNYKVQANADIAHMTTFDSGKKGFYYGADHSFTKDTAFHIFYTDRQKLADNVKDTSFRATVSYNF
ncbi:hypothetical protein [Pelosinus sp. sgz500959]|uniref:hypothetical protein n=1 Tax=Pelosinus sp. sgz500959 TaxID=3242472 RepID=UPI003672FA18